MAVNFRRSAPRNSIGVENVPPLTAMRGRSVLPSWYHRTPLRDITLVVQGIERRRARYEGQQQTETLLLPVSVSGHEFEKLKKTTPSVKKAEREKRIRTLMSMR